MPTHHTHKLSISQKLTNDVGKTKRKQKRKKQKKIHFEL